MSLTTREGPAVQIKRPSELTLLVVLVDALSVLGLLGSVLVVFMGIRATYHVPDPGAPSAAMGPLVLGVGVVLGMIWLGVLVVAHFLWKGANWARITMISPMALSIILLLWALISGGAGGGMQAVISGLLIVLAALFIVVLNRADVKAYCRAQRSG